MNQNLLIFGAGQYGKVAGEIAEATGFFQRIAFLDDHSESAVGKIPEMEAFFPEYQYAVVAIGNPCLRINLLRKAKEAGYELAILIHPKAYISPTASLQGGCIVEPQAVVQTEAVVGNGTILSAGCIVNHNAVIGDGCHLDVGSIVTSNSVVPLGYKLEAGNVFSGMGISGTDTSKEKNPDAESSGSERSVAEIDENAEWVKKYVEEFGEMPGFF